MCVEGLLFINDLEIISIWDGLKDTQAKYCPIHSRILNTIQDI